jgi:hypothetical protein
MLQPGKRLELTFETVNTIVTGRRQSPRRSNDDKKKKRKKQVIATDTDCRATNCSSFSAIDKKDASFITNGGESSHAVQETICWNSPDIRRSLDAHIAMLPPPIASLLEPTPLPSTTNEQPQEHTTCLTKDLENRTILHALAASLHEPTPSPPLSPPTLTPFQQTNERLRATFLKIEQILHTHTQGGGSWSAGPSPSPSRHFFPF